MSKSPDRKRLTDLGSPPIPINALWIAKGDCFDISLFDKDNIKNLVLAAISLTRRRIPFDFQRTSLAGLALESATSPKVLKSSKPRSKCQFSQGAARCVIIPVVKNHQTQLHATQSLSATGLRGRKIKIS
ncbi:hypothetical protein TNCV_2254041 [Trichonephila clavipes]|nr:hypothetical protein TNCV_2254041 [Trichonephila clavipes]